MVEKAKLDHMITNLKRYLKILSSLAETPHRQFLKNSDKIGNAKYHFIIAIECCVDIANHIIASKNFRFPKDNADSFVVLIEEGIIGCEMKNKLRSMAKFRNRLVHLYWDVDDEKIHQYFQESLPDIERYIALITQNVV